MTYACLICSNETEGLFCSDECRFNGTKAAILLRGARKETKRTDWNSRYVHEKVRKQEDEQYSMGV